LGNHYIPADSFGALRCAIIFTLAPPAVNLLLAIQFYLNAFFLIPIFINQKKQPWLYFAFMLAGFIILNFIIVHTRPRLIFPAGTMPFGRLSKPPFAGNFNLLPLTAITAAAFAYRYLADRFRQINNEHHITNAALVSELAFLRSQISPHFIFNIINSAVALSRLNPTSVEPTLIQLSQLLRYMLYISDEETMRQKADYLTSYIELQRLRLGEQIRIDFSVDILNMEKTIEPMLLVPFVENAIKHGTGNTAAPAIAVHLKTDQKTLFFSVYNSYNPEDSQQDEFHGIGLNNVKRRLALLYPGKHDLTIACSENHYQVNLQIQFK
jgi:sensor histidine kinase YesM